MPKGKPNILILWGDDIGWFNISHNNRGMMGYKTPNIDRIAREGIEFTDYYGQQSCTAGRAAFITGQNPVRTGLTKVGIPGAEAGLQPEDPTIADLLKPLGYATGQFGKNHLGDRNKYLPTLHGFDEFYGNLYHLNAEEEPEDCRLSEGSGVSRAVRSARRLALQSDHRRRSDRRAALRAGRQADDRRHRAADEKTHGDVRRRRHRTCLGVHPQGARRRRPFFVWWNSTHMHFRTHIPDDAKGISGQGFYNDAMVLHDMAVGKMLDLLDELGIAGDTIVQYSTDNGPHYNTWPDGAITPWRSEKNTNWEGAYRVPSFVRWPGKFEAGRIVNELASHQDWLPTLLAAAGAPDVPEKLLAGYQAGDEHFRVHIDGYNLLPYLLGEADASPRKFFFYVNDDGMVVALRLGDWKAVFYEQRAKTMALWAEPFVELRIPKIFNLRRDPFERADENANAYWDWMLDHAYVIYPAAALTAAQIQGFIDYPPRQKPDSFNLDRVLEKVTAANDGGLH